MSLLVDENFESTGTPSGWFRGGSADFDYTASPLTGSQSLHFDSATSDYAYILGGGSVNHAEIWFKFQFRCDSITGDQHLVLLQDGSFNDLYRVIFLNSTKVLAVQDTGAGIFQLTTDSLTVGTIYNVWGHYKKGTGSNGICEVSFDVVANPRPNAGNKWAGGITSISTANAERAGLFPTAANGSATYDNVQIADTDVFGAVTVSVNLTGVGATPAVGTLTFNGSFTLAGAAATPAIGTGTVTTDTPATVTVTLTGVGATPAIGIGHVAIEGEVITPPVEDLVPGRMWYGLPEDEKVYLTGVSANPRVGEIRPVGKGTLEQLEKMYPFPKRVEERPLPVARRKAPKPSAFVYLAGVHPVPKIGRMTIKAFYEDSDEELSSILKMMDVDEELISALKLAK